MTQLPSRPAVPNSGTLTLPPSMRGPRLVMPMTPPHERFPMSGPRPAALKRAGKMSPSEAESSSRMHTRWPVNTVEG